MNDFLTYGGGSSPPNTQHDSRPLFVPPPEHAEVSPQILTQPQVRP